MGLTELANLAEVIGTVAIVVSLIYLAVQIRQSTRATKLATAQNLSRDFRDVISATYSDAEFSRIHLQGLKDVRSLTNEDKYRVYVFSQTYFRVLENAYYQYRSGAVDEFVWEAFLAQMKFIKGASVIEAFWRDRQHIFSKDFRDYYNDVAAADASIAVAPYTDTEE